ncbi:MAG TPA: SufD family Fe-S cluster assembly protein [Steroidobacteraceae bacterium]|nr:SufD family Fe-S cluster assembly protein [Steroidobacteraceae bacterium]
MNAVAKPVPGSMSNAAYEQRLRDAVMDAAPLLNARLLPVGVRSAALNKALAAGLPQLRDDLWRYADLRFLASAALAPVPAQPGALAAAIQPLLPPRLTGYTRLVFGDGRLLETLSDSCPALDAAATPLVPERTRHERFGWLNDAFATGVARLEAAGTLQLEVIFAATHGASRQAVYPRLELNLAAHADVVLVERHVGSTGAQGLVNAAVQLHCGPASRLRHLRWQALGEDAQLLDTVQLALDRDAHCQLTQLQLGARTARTSLRASLYGTGASLTLHGVAIAGGRRTLDQSLLVDHLAPHAQSSQVFRAVARDAARLACRSRVEAGRTARGSLALQSLKGLLAGGGEIDLRPQLEILTDEVRASHGATTGALDENMRFYLAARGLDPDTARALLEWAFLEDALRGLDPPGLRAAAERAVAAALGSDVALQVLA